MTNNTHGSASGSNTARPEAVRNNSISNADLKSLRAQIGALPDSHPAHTRFRKVVLAAIKLPKPSAIKHLRKHLSPYALINDAVMIHPHFYDVLVSALNLLDIQVVDAPTYEAVERCAHTMYTTSELQPWLEVALSRIQAIRIGSATGASPTVLRQRLRGN